MKIHRYLRDNMSTRLIMKAFKDGLTSPDKTDKEKKSVQYARLVYETAGLLRDNMVDKENEEPSTGTWVRRTKKLSEALFEAHLNGLEDEKNVSPRSEDEDVEAWLARTVREANPDNKAYRYAVDVVRRYDNLIEEGSQGDEVNVVASSSGDTTCAFARTSPNSLSIGDLLEYGPGYFCQVKGLRMSGPVPCVIADKIHGYMSAHKIDEHLVPCDEHLSPETLQSWDMLKGLDKEKAEATKSPPRKKSPKNKKLGTKRIKKAR